MVMGTVASYVLYLWVLGANPTNFAPQLAGGFATEAACKAAGEAIKTTTLQTAWNSEKNGFRKLVVNFQCVATGN